MLTPWKESYDQPRQHIKKQRRYFANKGPSNQGYGFSSGHVWMWELDYKKAEHWRIDAFEPPKIKSLTVSTVSPCICHEVMGPDAMILVLWTLSFKPTFSLSSLTFIKSLFSSSLLSAISVVSSQYLRLLIFLPAILIPACASSSPVFLIDVLCI